MKSEKKNVQLTSKAPKEGAQCLSKAQSDLKSVSIFNQYQLPESQLEVTIRNEPARGQYNQLGHQAKTWALISKANTPDHILRSGNSPRVKTSSKQRKPILRHRRKPIEREGQTQDGIYQITKDQEIEHLKTVVEFLSTKLKAQQESARKLRVVTGQKWLMQQLKRVHQMFTEQKWKVNQLTKQLDLQKEKTSMLQNLVNIQTVQLTNLPQNQPNDDIEALKLNTINIISIKDDMETLKQDIQCLKAIVSEQRAYISELEIQVKLFGGIPSQSETHQNVDSPSLAKKFIRRPGPKARSSCKLSTISEKQSQYSSQIHTNVGPQNAQFNF